MDFTYQERNIITEMIESASLSLFNAMKYIYAISDELYYNVNVKDIFKVSLSDVTNTTILDNISISLNSADLGEVATPQFKQIIPITQYAFLIRLPFLKSSMENCPLRDSQIRELYNLGLKRGAENINGIVEHDLRSMYKIIKNKHPEPAFDSEWFRRWVYTFGQDLAAINNRNMFFLGCVEALFPLYYAALTEKLTTLLIQWRGL